MKMSNIKQDLDAIVMLRGYMRQKQITQQMIADRSGIKRCNVSSILSGNRVPTLPTFLKLVEAAGLRMEIVDKL